MKIIAIIVLTILALIPFILSIIRLAYRAINNGAELTISQSAKIKDASKIRKSRKAFIIIAVLYSLIIIIAVIWAFSVLFSSYFH